MNNKIDQQIDSSKRNFLKTMGSLAAVGAVASWIPTKKAQAWFFLPQERIANFPNEISVYRQLYENWSGESRYESVWTAIPKTQAQVLAIINWAVVNGYKSSGKGMSHNW